jgi:serine/threonine-protein kinase
MTPLAMHDLDTDERARALVGTTLREKYRLDRLLGVGGMAAVYLATHRNGRTVALKLLHAELARSREIRERFVREGHAANAVRHPGAVAVLDDDVSEAGAAFLVMELLEGKSLEEIADARGRLPFAIVCEIGVELLDVLAAAHEHGVVHRDIKPANLFVTTTGQVKVLDFGIARLLDAAGGATKTQTGLALGTPAFMSPEQALGKASEVDARSDVWSAGATLFALASGKLVHEEGETAQELLVRAATTPARALASVAPEAPTAFAAVIDRALAFDKANRWSSATEMRAALAQAARSDALGACDLCALVARSDSTATTAPRDGYAIATQVATSAPVAAQPARGDLRRVLVTAGVTFALGAVIVTAWMLRPSARSASAIAPPPPVIVASSASASAPPIDPRVPIPEPLVSTDPQSDSPAPAAAVAKAPAVTTTTAGSKPAPTNTTTAKAGCNPPYRVDFFGNKVWKRECL